MSYEHIVLETRGKVGVITLNRPEALDGDLSAPVVMMAKEAVNRAFETPLAEGRRFELRLFHATSATEDRKEGMPALVEKRAPQFRNR